MSDTPLTDAHQRLPEMAYDHLWSEFAKGLERKSANLLKALTDLKAEYDDRASQWGADYLWGKHENKEVIQTVEACLREYTEH